MPRNNFGLSLKKLAVSSFVVFSFVAYVLDQWISGGQQSQSRGTPVTQSTSGSQVIALPNPQASTLPTRTSIPGSLYKDGIYTGLQEDALYGWVQVQVTIQGGKVSNVEALEYPQDRRTSRMINSQAIPWLTSEAIQAQSARVNMISGATLTSEAFIESLQTALESAKS
jgi:uncharacterized protein with FMN-binding domain